MLVYLLCIAVVGIPIMMSEVMLGRLGRQSPINTMTRLARAEGAHPAWSLIGWGGVLAGFFILSYYSVIARLGHRLCVSRRWRRVFRDRCRGREAGVW